MQPKQRIWQTKTFWAAIGGAYVAIGAYLAGEIDSSQLLQALFIAMLGLTGRHAISKIGCIVPFLVVALASGCAWVDPGGQTRRALRQEQLIDWNTDLNTGTGQLWAEGKGTHEQRIIGARGRIVLAPDANGGLVIDPERSEISEYVFIDPKADQAAGAFRKAVEESTKQVQMITQSFDRVISALIPLIAPGPGGGQREIVGKDEG